MSMTVYDDNRDDARDAVVLAARKFDEQKEKLAEYEARIKEAIVVIESRNTRIEQLELSNAELRTENARLRNERDDANMERDQLRLVLASVQTDMRYQLTKLEDLVLPFVPPKKRATRKAKVDSPPVPEGNGNGNEAVANEESEARTFS